MQMRNVGNMGGGGRPSGTPRGVRVAVSINDWRGTCTVFGRTSPAKSGGYLACS